MNARPCLLLLAATVLACPGLLLAQAPSTVKLYAGRVTAPSVEAGFGAAIAANARWIAVGEPGNDEVSPDAGVVHVFDARTGRHLRKLTAQDGVEPRQFGLSVAIWGNLLLVGAPFDSEMGANAGAAYLFDLRNGAQLAKWTVFDGLAGDIFGCSVAIWGDFAVIGALGEDTLGAEAGAAYVFRVSTGAGLHKLTASDGALDHRFGLSVALQNGVAVIGAPQADGAAAGSGAVYLFDAETGEQADKFESGVGGAGDYFGMSVAIDGSLVMVGAPGHDLLAADSGTVFFFDWKQGAQLAAVSNGIYNAIDDGFGSSVALSEGMALVGASSKAGYRGAAYRIDLRNGLVPEQILAPDGKALDFFGQALALSANQMFIGAPYEDTLANNAGSVHWIRGAAATLPLKSQLRTSSAAPGAAAALISRLGSASINRQGMVMIEGGLRGAGAQGGRNQALWSSLGATDLQSLLLQRQDSLSALGADFTGTFVSRATGVALNQNFFGLLRAQLRGPGVGRLNNQAVLLDNGAGLLPVVRTGVPLGLLGGASLRSVREIVQNRDAVSPRLALLCNARLQAGLVSAAQDSGLLIANGATGTLLDVSVFEGRPAAGGGVFGQFSPRVAMRDGYAVVSTRRLDAGVNVPALFRRLAGVLTDPVVDAGVAAPGAGGALFRNFIGEGINDQNQVLLRATLTGAGVTGRNNEGLWHQGVGLVARRGQPIPGEAAGVLWRRFLGFWPVADNGMVIHAAASGPGFRPGETGLWLLQEDGSFLRLLRTGDEVAADGARVRRLLRVDVDATLGAYTILTSLTGAAARNQALFTGFLAQGHPVAETSLRKPWLRLRKGIQMASTGGAPVMLRGLRLPVATDRSGAGAKGLGQAVSIGGQVAVTLLRGDRTIEVARLDDVTLKP